MSDRPFDAAELAELLSSIPVRRRDAYAAELGDGSVVYRNSELHRLDPVGALLWDLLDGESTLEEISADVASVFGEDPERCAIDIAAFAQRLAAVGLISLMHGA